MNDKELVEFLARETMHTYGDRGWDKAYRSAEHIVRALAENGLFIVPAESVVTGLGQLHRAIREGDPAAELLVRVGDLRDEIGSANQKSTT